MAKKYLKNGKGIVRAITTNSLQLEKPLLNENYDIEVHNRNMDKIDSAIQEVNSAIQEVKGKVDGLELKAERVTIADTSNKFTATNVEDALLENKTSILEINKNIDDLKLSVSNGKELIANAITDKGVEASKSDSFQVLANKIGYLSNIDIKVTNELPEIVKNGQIVVITDKKPTNIIFDYEYPSSSLENDLFIKLYTEKTAKNFIIGNDTKINLYLFGVEQYIGGVYKKAESYIGENGVWIGMNNYYLVDSYSKMDISSMYEIITASRTTVTIENNYLPIIIQNPSNTRVQGGIRTLNRIDFTPYSKLVCKCWINSTTTSADNQFRVRIIRDNGDTVAITQAVVITVSNSSTKEVTLKIDTTNINDAYKVQFEGYCYNYNTTIKILEAYAE